ncbi:cell surface protein SprA [Aliifodinibius sp. S!AR15-10]|uniref:T9SS outer membrane translocon Sov/SprA n=1 Tax=Aliifodinibius sp. S!AR15-10 TaxID=2950437 RepID=UPI00287021C9|nr:cell surface protein SprA [Aliifodinibius sp. S!AR15-10]
MWGSSFVTAFSQVQTDSTSSASADTLQQDSLGILRTPPVVSYPYPDEIPNIYYIRLSEEQTRVARDSLGNYVSQRRIGDIEIALPYVMDQEEYAARTIENSKRENWKTLVQEFESQQTSQRGLLDFKVDIPGGQESTFTTIFGKPEVNLKVNGTANMNLGATIQKTENPHIPEDQQTQIDPTFEQSLKLNIQGTIGDKLSIQTDWDTEREFDFMNRLNIVYQGYEDEIIQRLEMGNVSMETGNTLIRGGSSLFGVKSVAQLGALEVTSVLSQQEGEGNTQTITGGAQEQDISIRPADYENDTHFFLDFFTRQQFEQNMSNPQQLGQALQLSEVKVWILRESTQSFDGERQAIAMVDLGVVQNPDSSYAPPNDDLDSFPEDTLDQYRDPAVGVSAADFGVEPSEFVEGYFIPLQEGADYELNRPLGYLSLKRNLGSRQALAISFKYLNPQTGETVTVGDVSQGGGNRIFLKLIRPQNVTTTNSAWDLMMKNIYSLGVSNVSQDGLEVDISYTEQNLPQNTLPGRNTIMLRDLGLDRVDAQGATNPDNQIDFSSGTLNPVSGTIIFPYLEPFGGRIASVLSQSSISQPEIDRLAFNELYSEKKVNASQSSKNNFYLIDGTSKGSVSDSYSLGFSLVEGSVKVYANGQELQEGTDYTVDYSIGNITILNERYLAKGQEIKIEYENNQFTQIERKTFTGVRAEYHINSDITLGSTYFKLKERPLQDKIRIGDAPINNSVIGFDANARFDMPWMTRAIDRVPLLQTKTESSFSLSGEFAQLRPDVVQTNAVSDAIEDNELFQDEENGLVFVDDFEGTDISLSFLRPSRWSLAAAPAAIPGYAPDEPYFGETPPQTPNVTLNDKIARSDLRGQFAWYTIPQNIEDILGSVERTPESRQVQVTDVFPNRDVLSEENYISTLDVFYDPTTRGPYNYNTDIQNITENEPNRMWGGMTTTLPSGQEDLTQNNIEFLEFWVQSVLPGGRDPNAPDLEDYEGTIYIDVGIVSEDVVPNFKSNSEDGLAKRPDDLQEDILGGNARSYIPIPPPAPEGQFSNENRSLEDVGLDGAPNTEGIDRKNELQLFNSYLNEMRAIYGADSQEFQQIRNDPSNDDYVYYGQDEVSDEPLHVRFHRMYGYHEGNTPLNSQDDKRAVTNRPDAEGLITPSIVEQNNAYFQYEVHWNPADFDELEVGNPDNYIVDKVPGSSQENRWYQVRIPLKDYIRKVGGINNFQNISYIRVWFSGYEKPFTMRFATFELVGSQWRPAENVDQNQTSQADLRISSVNIEENSRRRPVPYRIPEGAIRSKNRSQQRQTVANEQSIVLETQNLGPQEVKMVKRVYPGGLNMVNYSNLRMFVHGEGYENREDAQLVMRFGTDLVNNYYEYRQPITPTDDTFPFSSKPLSELTDAEREQESEEVWLSNQNSVNIVLRAFNELKQIRDQQGMDPSEVFSRPDLLQNAPPGAEVAIKGNPSLDRIGEIGMGIRNPFDPENPDVGTSSLDAEFWLNELRVSGFDNRKGWAANAKAELQLADLATVNANVNRETDGFGSLNSRLGQRRVSDVLAYDLNSTFNLHKFIPDRFGWNIPVTVSTRRSTSTPRFLPNQGDVRLSEFEQAVRNRDDINEQEQESIINQKIRESQTVSESYSINLSNVTKRESQSRIAQYTLDNTNLNFVYNTTDQRNPEYRFQNNWNYNGSIRYNINFRQTKLFRPFGFLGSVPLLSSLSGLQLGYTPSSLNASAGVDRNYDERRRRVLDGQQNVPLQQSHNFSYNTNFGLGYNLTPSIRTSFQSRTVFDLSSAGTRPAISDNPADSSAFDVRPTFDVFEDLIFDTLRSRRSNYEEAYSAAWQPRLSSVEALSWTSYSANYNGGYQWRNSPQGSNLGATLTNNLNVTQNLELDIRDLLNRMGWYQRLHEENSNTGPPQQVGAEDGEAENGSGDGIGVILKEGAQALLSFQSIDISFNNTKRSQQAGYSGDSQIFYMFNTGGDDFSPPFSYRTGWSDRIGAGQLVGNPSGDQSIQIPSNKNYTDDITVGTRLTPFENFSIDLTWSSKWDVTSTRTLTLQPDQMRTSVRTRNGNINSSVWAFGGGYADLFHAQLGRAFDDINDQNDIIADSTGNGDGSTVLGKLSLQEDFRKAYLGMGTGAIGKREFTPFPQPGWRVVWSGFENIFPFVGEWMSRASINHSYSGQYRLGWVLNSGSGELQPLSLGAYTIRDYLPEYEPTSITIEKKFSPLVGLNITWDSNLRTNLQYDWSKITSLALSNTTVTERFSRGFKFSFSYTVRDFKIPFFPRIENAVDFTLNTSYLEDTEQKLVLNSDLANALQADHNTIVKDVDSYDFQPGPITGQSRVNGSAIVGYQFSQTIKANFEYTYSRLIPKSTGVYARTDHDIRFNVVVSIRSN